MSELPMVIVSIRTDGYEDQCLLASRSFMVCGTSCVLICGHEWAGPLGTAAQGILTPTTHSSSHSDLWFRAGFARHGQEGCGDARERPELGERQATGQRAWGQVWEKRKECFM